MKKSKEELAILLDKEKLLNRPDGGNNSYFQMQINYNLLP